VTNQAFRSLLTLLIAVLLSACTRLSDSVGSILAVSFDGKPIATLNVSLRCSYDWAYFSERDMASHYNVTPTPAKAPNVFGTLPDRRLLSLSPKPWPPLDETGRCNLLELKGWQALVFDPRKPIPLLTIVSKYDGTAGDLAGMTIHPSSSNDSNVSSRTLTAPLAFQQAVEKASSLDFAVLEVPRAGDAATKIPAETVSALWFLPTDRPSILLPAQRSNTPLNLDGAGSDDTFVGLPDFHATKVMDENAFSTSPSAPGLPISINPYDPKSSLKVYFPSDVPTPAVTLPGLDSPLMIAPVAAVWYPATRRLVVFTWIKRAGELTRLINLEKAVNHRGTELKNKEKVLCKSLTNLVDVRFPATYCFL